VSRAGSAFSTKAVIAKEADMTIGRVAWCAVMLVGVLGAGGVHAQTGTVTGRVTE
jgi:hypothetical protein